MLLVVVEDVVSEFWEFKEGGIMTMPPPPPHLPNSRPLPSLNFTRLWFFLG